MNILEKTTLMNEISNYWDNHPEIWELSEQEWNKLLDGLINEFVVTGVIGK